MLKKISGDVLYLDPPYNNRQYCSNYHLLETLSKYDEPEGKTKTGLRGQDKHKKSLFCSKIHAKQELENVLRLANFKHIYVSYNDEGIITPEEFERIMSGFGDYRAYTKQHRKYASRKQATDGKTAVTEFLHYLRKQD